MKNGFLFLTGLLFSSGVFGSTIAQLYLPCSLKHNGMSYKGICHVSYGFDIYHTEFMYINKPKINISLSMNTKGKAFVNNKKAIYFTKKNYHVFKSGENEYWIMMDE